MLFATISTTWRLSWVRSWRCWLRRKPWMPNTTRICFLSLPPTLLVLLPYPVFSMFLRSSFYHLVCTSCCPVCLHDLANIGYILSWLFRFIAMPCLSYYLFVRDSDGQYHQRTNTWVYRRLLFFFPPLPKWWWLQTPWFTLFALLTLFRWCQRGKIGMTMVILVWLGLSWFL